MAPEVILQDYGPEADLWSVGMLLYQLLTGAFPFWDSVQNISLQQVRLCARMPCLCTLSLPIMHAHAGAWRGNLVLQRAADPRRSQRPSEWHVHATHRPKKLSIHSRQDMPSVGVHILSTDFSLSAQGSSPLSKASSIGL